MYAVKKVFSHFVAYPGPSYSLYFDFFFNPLVNHSCWFYLFIYLLCFYQRLLLLLPFVWKSALFLFVIYLLKAHKPLVATTVNSFPTIHIAAALFPIQPDASST